MKAPPSLTDTKGFEQYDTLFMQLSDDRRTVNAFELQVFIMFILIWVIRRLFVILIILIINMILAEAMVMIMTISIVTMTLFAGATGDLPTQRLHQELRQH